MTTPLYIETAESIYVNMGDLIADQLISCGNDLNVTMGSIETRGKIDVEGDIDCGSDISAGDLICAGYIKARGYVYAKNDITAQSSISVVNNYIEANNILALSGIKSGPIKCHNNLVADSIEANGYVVAANDIITIKDISATQSIVVGKRIYAGGTIKVGDDFNIISGYKIKTSEWKKLPCVRSASRPSNILAGEWKRISLTQVKKMVDEDLILEYRSAE